MVKIVDGNVIRITAQDTISRLYKEHYGDREKRRGLDMVRFSNGPSRNDLMLEAKGKGIKNFRILNKVELIEILKDETGEDRSQEIIQAAVARWKEGFGKKSKA